VSGGTFHSLALRVLRTYADFLGFANSFTILDRSDMEEVIGSLVPELGMPKGVPRFPKRGTLANILSKAANLQQPVDEFMTHEYGQFIEFTGQINRLSRLYGHYKKDHELMDYDDLILNLRRLLAEREEIRRELGHKYRYVLVDEYQDTNKIQSDIVKWLAYDHKNIMVVGDDSQSIYSFRGANYKNMFDFPSLYPGAKIIKLEENYRSTQPILTLTNSLMDQANEKYTKCLFTKREGGIKPKVIDTGTEPQQAAFVCRYIKEQMQQGMSTSDFAILFRAGYHSFELEAELTRQGFHYVKYGGFKFLESAHIKDFLAHLRVGINRDEAVSWVRVLRLVNNVGHAKSQAIIQWMRSNRIPPEQVGKWPGAGKKEKGIKSLGKLLARLASKKVSPESAVELVMEYYTPILKEKFDDYPKRERELQQLIIMAGRYKKLRSFLDDLVLDPPTSSADTEPGKKGESLTLSTVHSAKGLEWPVVFIIWVTEGRFPSAKSYGNPLDLEEERRLMYVGATRAKDQLIMCYPGQESVPVWQIAETGRGNGLSSFIRSLPGYVISHESPGFQKTFFSRKQANIESAHSRPKQEESSGLSRGSRVRHPAFGPGVVSRLVGKDKVEVLFRNAGRKLLHLEYTTLEKV